MNQNVLTSILLEQLINAQVNNQQTINDIKRDINNIDNKLKTEKTVETIRHTSIPVQSQQVDLSDLTARLNNIEATINKIPQPQLRQNCNLDDPNCEGVVHPDIPHTVLTQEQKQNLANIHPLVDAILDTSHPFKKPSMNTTTGKFIDIGIQEPFRGAGNMDKIDPERGFKGVFTDLVTEK